VRPGLASGPATRRSWGRGQPEARMGDAPITVHRTRYRWWSMTLSHCRCNTERPEILRRIRQESSKASTAP
jgi:hypothetical protein